MNHLYSAELPPMYEHYRYRSFLPPVPDGLDRPFWSVMIPTYNCAHYLRDTLAAVLAQDIGPDRMQIEVIDDCSTADDPEAVVRELAPGRVHFYRQPQNVGHVQNFQTCLQRARGQWVHLLHGDDFVRPFFYSKLQQGIERQPAIGAAFCRHVYMYEGSRPDDLSPLERAESGVLDNWLERIAIEQRIQTPSIAVRREVYERLGLFDSRLTWSEDWEMWVRIAAHYPVWYEPRPLAVYRIHADSSTGRQFRTGENMRDVRRAVDIIQAYLPSSIAASLASQSLQTWAFKCIRFTVPGLIARGDLDASIIQVREALKCSFSVPVVRACLPLILPLAKLWIRNMWR